MGAISCSRLGEVDATAQAAPPTKGDRDLHLSPLGFVERSMRCAPDLRGSPSFSIVFLASEPEVHRSLLISNCKVSDTPPATSSPPITSADRKARISRAFFFAVTKW